MHAYSRYIFYNDSEEIVWIHYSSDKKNVQNSIPWVAPSDTMNVYGNGLKCIIDYYAILHVIFILSILISLLLQYCILYVAMLVIFMYNSTL